MRIVSIKRDKIENKNGLDSINLNNLGKVVVLTGPNGSGKTRLLHTVKEMCNGYKNCKNEISQIKWNLERDKRNAAKSASGAFQMTVNESPYHSAISKQEQDLINKYNIEVSESEKTISLIDLSNELNNDFLNPDDFKLSDMKKVFDSVNKLSFQEIYKNINVILFYLFSEKYVKVHSAKYFEKSEIETIDKMTNDIVKIIKDNLGFILTYNDSEILLNNQKITSLSVGQLTILKLSVASYFNQSKIADSILLFDEPENHLHPKSAIEILDFICKSVGQIWIATHNINIISHFYSQSIIFIENGIVKMDGFVQKSVLNSLIGVNADELRIFIDSTYDFELTQFSYECLFKPVALNYKDDDLQMFQFQEIILLEMKKTEQDKIKFLDYGVGKGRLLSFLKETNELNSILNKLDYFAYDDNSSDGIFCRSLISSVYNDTVRYFNDIGILINTMPKFDIILLSNVLHEIPVTNWMDLFHTKLYKLLSDNGIILILENSETIIGENAHKYGFLAIDSVSIKKVFQNDSIECISNSLSLPNRFKPETIKRIQAHIIKRKDILNVSHESIKTMLSNIQNKAINEIKNIKEANEKNLRQGKRLGFYYQQYASSSMALYDLEDKNSKLFNVK